MKRIHLILVSLLFFHVPVGNAQTAAQKIQVSEFTVTGAEQAGDLKTVLKNLLSSRIASNDIIAVDSEVGVAAKITGSYASFGKTFSIDASVKNAAGETLGQRYVQGESPNDLIPAIGKLADQLRPLLPVKRPVIPAFAAAGSVPVTPESVEAAVRVAPVAQPVTQQTRIEGTLIGIAPGRALPGKEREFVVADARSVYLYRQTDTLKKVAEYPVTAAGKILAIDTADVDNDGIPEAYVTVVDREELVSLALEVNERGFTPIAEKLPFFLRAVALFGQKRVLIGQYAGRGADDFYGDVRKVVKKGTAYSLGEPVKLPHHADIFSFNYFFDTEGKRRTVYIDRDRMLHIADDADKELWKGADHAGGSETYFLRDEQQIQNISLDRYRWRFIEQRIEVLPDGIIIVPQNSGSLSVGNQRSFSKSSVTAYAWNGASLEERWHTMESPGYLADYCIDTERRELIMLEQPQKEGVFSKGASVIVTKKIRSEEQR
ncbi:MAG: VCBS repeat-containing protein [Desulfuromonadaceae bacterium]|nr:VCBS repeat-containing protein [Desulfuromonadaceae bacterium]MDD5105007.1 VCBS repeat-containing protein [Desulfuromonadaceae bacterium]